MFGLFHPASAYFDNGVNILCFLLIRMKHKINFIVDFVTTDNSFKSPIFIFFRLLRQLLEVQKSYQEVLHQSIEERKLQISHMRLVSDYLWNLFCVTFIFIL